MNNMKHKRKIKFPSLSPPNISKFKKKAEDQSKPHLSDSCPPRYIPVKGIFILLKMYTLINVKSNLTYYLYAIWLYILPWYLYLVINLNF